MNKLVLECEMPSTAHLCEHLAPRWCIVWESCGTFMEACLRNNQFEQQVETGYVGQGPESSSSENDLAGGQKFQKIICFHLFDVSWMSTSGERSHMRTWLKWRDSIWISVPTGPNSWPAPYSYASFWHNYLQGSQNSNFLAPWTLCTSSVCLSVFPLSVCLSVCSSFYFYIFPISF